MARVDATAGEADDLSVASHDPPREDRGPASRDLALAGFDNDVRHRLAGRKFPEVAPLADAHIRYRPSLTRIDQPAAGVEQIERADMGKRLQLGPQHLVDGEGG